MTRDQLKKKIKETFGTYSRFAKMAQIDRYQFQKEFLTSKNVSPKYLAGIEKIYGHLSEQEVTLTNLGPRLKLLRSKLNDYGGVYKFCEDYPEYNAGSVYSILNRSKRWQKTTALKLFKHFGV